MPTIKIREKDTSTGSTIATVLIGAVAGFAVGMYVAQRVGGFSGLAAKLRPRRRSGESRAAAYYEAAGEDFLDDEFDDEDLVEDVEEEDLDEFDDDELAETADAKDGADGAVPEIEERVLEAFNNDPILSERAIDIGAVGFDSIELEGWVDDDTEAEHAVTIARGVPGVRSVANHLMVDAEG